MRRRETLPRWLATAGLLLCQALLTRHASRAGATEQPPPSASDPCPQPDPCDPPTFMDARGIRRVRYGCLVPAVASPAPAQPSPGAATVRPSDDIACESPTYLDRNGIHRVRFECLEP